MVKTIFYKKCDFSGAADYFFDGKPHIVWFTLDGILYESDKSQKYTLIERTRETIYVLESTDEFTDDGITRRIRVGI